MVLPTLSCTPVRRDRLYLPSSWKQEGYTATLGTAFTPLTGSSKARIQNVGKAAGKLNGLTLAPGEVFSFNERVGPREAPEYLPAPVIQGGEMVDRVGGGICQVSSTVYHAVLLADLKMDKRHHHTRRISYAPPGLDATVSWNGPDLIFRNSLSQPVRIGAGLRRDCLVVAIYAGEPLPYEVTLEVEEEKTVSAGGVKGTFITVHRVRKKDGEVLSSDYLHRDYYQELPAED